MTDTLTPATDAKRELVGGARVVHRVFMNLAWLCGITALLLVLIDVASDVNGASLAIAALGYAITLLVIAGSIHAAAVSDPGKV